MSKSSGLKNQYEKNIVQCVRRVDSALVWFWHKRSERAMWIYQRPQSARTVQGKLGWRIGAMWIHSR